LRWTLSKVVMSAEEAQRLEQEEQASRSFIKQIHRVLMPTRGGANVQLAAQLVSHMAHQNEIEVTALYAMSDRKPGRKAGNTATINKDDTADRALATVVNEMQLPADTTLQTKVESGHNNAEVILKEASKGYDLIVLGATGQKRSKGALFNWLVDRVVQEAPCATMVVKSHLPQAAGESCAIASSQLEHILVPTVGTHDSTNAVEVACTIAAQTGALVTLVHVINLPQVEYILYEQQTLNPVKDMANDMVEQQAEIGRLLGAKVNIRVLTGTHPEREVLKFARTEGVDLIILGSDLRIVTGRVFFGHAVDAILSKANCPVAVITSS
jgi:nucleotide-binding universal stress UspA family protein